MMTGEKLKTMMKIYWPAQIGHKLIRMIYKMQMNTNKKSKKVTKRVMLILMILSTGWIIDYETLIWTKNQLELLKKSFSKQMIG